jgi:hypothetical protein
MTQRAIFLLVLFAFWSGSREPHAEQTPGQSSDDQRHAQAIGFLRTVNTAEVMEFHKSAAYATWPTLQAHQAQFLNRFLQQNYPAQAAAPQFSPEPEIIPGWSLRLEVHADGKGYDLRLLDLDDKSCSYAAISDESGIIRQSKAIDCPI